MKLYVAGSWPDRAECLKLMQRLSGLGHTITQWWPIVEAEGTTDQEVLSSCAEGDRRGVITADALVACPGWFGTATEVGLALGRGIPVIYYRSPETAEWSVSHDPAWRESIFYHLEGRRTATSFEELVAALNELQALRSPPASTP